MNEYLNIRKDGDYILEERYRLGYRWAWNTISVHPTWKAARAALKAYAIKHYGVT